MVDVSTHLETNQRRTYRAESVEAIHGQEDGYMPRTSRITRLAGALSYGDLSQQRSIVEGYRDLYDGGQIDHYAHRRRINGNGICFE